MKNTHGRMVLLVKIQGVFTYFKLQQWYQISQSVLFDVISALGMKELIVNFCHPDLGRR